MTADRRWMHAALTLAARGLGRVWPNPAVGCVIVQDTDHGGRVVGRGWTQPGGRPHAETMALAQAGPAAKGATAYVSLEPCAHHGKTPPCCDALIAAGVSRVVSPMEDPDPRVAGQGFGRMRDAGIAVAVGLLADEAYRANEGFLMRQRLGRPKMTLKLASSMDGGIATASGESRWITGPAARRRVHLMRAQSDAIMVGAGSARTDDPGLDVRLAGFAGCDPVPVIVGGAAKDLPPKLMAGLPTRPLWHVRGADGQDAPGVQGIGVRRGRDGLDLPEAMQALGARGMTRVLSEGGGRMAASLIKAGLVDEIVWMTAGLALGADGLPAISAMGLDQLKDAPRFDLQHVERIGEDSLSIWRPQRQSQA